MQQNVTKSIQHYEKDFFCTFIQRKRVLSTIQHYHHHPHSLLKKSNYIFKLFFTKHILLVLLYYIGVQNSTLFRDSITDTSFGANMTEIRSTQAASAREDRKRKCTFYKLVSFFSCLFLAKKLIIPVSKFPVNYTRFAVSLYLVLTIDTRRRYFVFFYDRYRNEISLYPHTRKIGFSLYEI